MTHKWHSWSKVAVSIDIKHLRVQTQNASIWMADSYTELPFDQSGSRVKFKCTKNI